MNFIRKHKIDLIIFGIALVARVFLFGINFHAEHWNLLNTIHGDDGYYEISRNFAAGHGFTGEDNPPYHPNPLRTPVYILFIAGILWLTKSYWVVIILQMIIGALIPVLGRHIALKLLHSEKIALSVGILTSFEPYLVLFSSIFYTETLFIFLFLIFILVFLSYLENANSHLFFLSSFILGIATLTKTTVQYLPILLVPLFVWHFWNKISRREIFYSTAVFIFIFLVTLSPWLYRNYREFGVVGMTAQPAFNAYVYLVPSVLAFERGTNFTVEYKSFIIDRGIEVGKITLANSSYYTGEALKILKEHPKGIFLVTLNSFVAFFTHDGMLTVLQHTGIVPSIYLSQPALSLLLHSPKEFFITVYHFITSPIISVLIMRLLWIAVTVAFFVGSIIFVKKHGLKAQTAFAILLVFYFLVTTPLNGLGVNARFRMPVNPIILTFAVYFILRKENELELKIS